MANVVNSNFSYAYDGILTQEVLVKPAVTNPDVTQLFRVIPGVKSKYQLNLTTPLGKIVQGAQQCGNTRQVTGSAVEITNRELETCGMEVYLEQCYDVFQSTILERALRSGIDESDLSGTQIGGLINGMVSEAIGREIFRIFSFGDTTSPAGDPSYYGMCDGLWTRLIAGESGYAVSKIDSISALNQTAGTRALDYLRNLFEGAPNILKQIPVGERRFFVTQNVYENLMTTYEDKTLDGGGLLQRLEGGVPTLFFRGVPVIPLIAWDAYISADNLGNNTRILYTTPQNHVIGVDNQADSSNFMIWRDMDTDVFKIRAKFRLGYNYVHDELQATSYGNV